MRNLTIEALVLRYLVKRRCKTTQDIQAKKKAIQESEAQKHIKSQKTSKISINNAEYIQRRKEQQQCIRYKSAPTSPGASILIFVFAQCCKWYKHLKPGNKSHRTSRMQATHLYRFSNTSNLYLCFTPNPNELRINNIIKTQKNSTQINNRIHSPYYSTVLTADFAIYKPQIISMSKSISKKR